GHRGQSPLARFLIGSVAEKLSQTSPYPVWVHRGEKTVSPKKVLLPCDLQPRSSVMAEYLAPLSKTFHSKFELFHVFQEPAPVLDYELWSAMIETQRQSENQQIDRLKKKNPKTPVKCVIGLPAKQIARRAKAFDLIALPRRNQKARSPFFGSVTRKLVRDAETPLLILP
ncbi:MAG: universal stress protein, partial [Bdellovibrionota bacterium]